MKIFEYNGQNIAFDFGNGQTMINATQMGKVFDKKPIRFLRNAQTERFIQVLSRSTNMYHENLVRKVQGGNHRLQGTWMHEKLALKFAAWLSPEFELWVFDRIEELMKNGVTTINNEDSTILNAINILQERVANNQKQLYAARAKIMRDEPKVKYHDNVLRSRRTYKVTVIAKELGMTARELNRYLKNEGIQFYVDGSWVLKAKYQNQGLTETDTFVYETYGGDYNTRLTLTWTEKGRKFIHDLLEPSIIPID